MNKASQSQAAGIAVIRVLIGWSLFTHGWSWLGADGFDGNVVLDSVNASLADMSGILHWWGENVVLKNPDASALLWRLGALFIGASFLLGALVRPAGYFACFFLLQGIAFGPAANSQLFWIYLIPCLGCAIGCAGRAYGMDKALDENCPAWMTWTKHKKGSNLFS